MEVTTAVSYEIRQLKVTTCRRVSRTILNVFPKSLAGGHDLPRSAPAQSVECAACTSSIPRKHSIKAPACGHIYCPDCFDQLVAVGCAEAYFPPKCCLLPIPKKLIKQHTTGELARRYKTAARAAEIPLGQRWYCPFPNCGKIINSRLAYVGNKGMMCMHCRKNICVACRQPAHKSNVECGAEELRKTRALGASNGWCSCACGQMIEMISGCRHVTCTCGAQFCWSCGQRWCTCRDIELCNDRYYAHMQLRAVAEAAATGAVHLETSDDEQEGNEDEDEDEEDSGGVDAWQQHRSGDFGSDVGLERQELWPDQAQASGSRWRAEGHYSPGQAPPSPPRWLSPENSTSSLPGTLDSQRLGEVASESEFTDSSTDVSSISERASQRSRRRSDETGARVQARQEQKGLRRRRREHSGCGVM